MLQVYDHPEYKDMKTCHLYTALEAAMQIEKKKIIAGPRDSVGIMLFNTVLVSPQTICPVLKSVYTDQEKRRRRLCV